MPACQAVACSMISGFGDLEILPLDSVVYDWDDSLPITMLASPCSATQGSIVSGAVTFQGTRSHLWFWTGTPCSWFPSPLTASLYRYAPGRRCCLSRAVHAWTFHCIPRLLPGSRMAVLHCLGPCLLDLMPEPRKSTQQCGLWLFLCAGVWISIEQAQTGAPLPAPAALQALHRHPHRPCQQHCP